MNPVLLSKEEYERGYIDADADLPEGCGVEIYTETSEEQGGGADWKGPYGPEGAVVESPPHEWQAIRIGLNHPPGTALSPALHRVRWERNGLNVLYPGGFGTPIRLGYSREIGTACRRVIRPIGVDWPETLVFLTDDTRIRFSKEPLQISPVRTSGVTAINDEGKLVTDARIEDAHTEEPTVEITSSERNDFDEGATERARAKVDGWVGILALMLGDGFAGEVLSEEYVRADATGETAIVVLPTQFSPPPTLPSDEIESELAKGYDRDTRVELALRWYTRGLYSPDPLDAFASYFFGLESLATSWFGKLTPRPQREELAAARAYLAKAKPSPPKPLKDRILDSLGRFSLEDQFSRYWVDVIGEEIGTTFRRMNRLRNEVAHGRRTTIDDQDMMVCSNLLRRALETELSISAAPGSTRRVHARFAAEIALRRPPIRFAGDAGYPDTQRT